MKLPNKALQATAAALRALAVARRHNAVVADASAPPAAVPELGRQAARTRMKIRIKSTPLGEAPEQVRQAWIGLEIPVPPRFAELLQAADALDRSGRARQALGYIVDAGVALELLTAHSPEAAEWWRRNAPRLVEPGSTFGFDDDCCEELHETTA